VRAHWALGFVMAGRLSVLRRLLGMRMLAGIGSSDGMNTPAQPGGGLLHLRCPDCHWGVFPVLWMDMKCRTHTSIQLKLCEECEETPGFHKPEL
jgi:hypothetical protein